MTVEEKDIDILWAALDPQNADAAILYGDFCTACHKLKGNDLDFVLAHLKYHMAAIEKKLENKLDEEANAISAKVGEEENMLARLENELEMKKTESFSRRTHAQAELRSEDPRHAELQNSMDCAQRLVDGVKARAARDSSRCKSQFDFLLDDMRTFLLQLNASKFNSTADCIDGLNGLAEFISTLNGLIPEVAKARACKVDSSPQAALNVENEMDGNTCKQLMVI